jgi:hypothetical protein
MLLDFDSHECHLTAKLTRAVDAAQSAPPETTPKARMRADSGG